MNPNVTSALLASALCIFLPPSAAIAQSCGLHSVPLSAPDGARTLVLGADLRSAGLAGSRASDGREIRGRLSEIAFQARFNAEGPWSVGWEWPLAILRLDETTRVGFGNPGGYAEYRIPAGSRPLSGPLPGPFIAFGAHAGLPLGDQNDGIASGHFMGAVYATLARVSAGMLWNGTLGTRMALPWMAGHKEDGDAASDPSLHAHASGFGGMSLDNPHENWELIYRGAVRREIGAGRWTGRLSVLVALEGQHVLSEPIEMGRVAEEDGNAARDFITGESVLSVSFGATEYSPHLRIPMTESRRAEWGLGVRISQRY